MQSYFVYVAGRRVQVRRAGTATTPLVIIPGWGTAARHYGPTLRLLARQYTCYCISLPGFGRTARLPAVWSLTDYEGWVALVLQELHLSEPIVLIGHSFGGGIAARYAQRFPDHVRHLILVNPIGIPLHDRIRTWALRMIRMLRHEVLYEAKFRALSVFWHMGRRHLHSLLGRKILWKTITRCLAEDVRDIYARITVPVTVIGGAQDRLLPIGNAAAIAQTIPHAAFISVPGAGHDLCNLEPALFYETLRPVLHLSS